MTHINAYYIDVQNAETKLKEAKAELAAAQARLESHPDYVAPKEEHKEKKREEKSAEKETPKKPIGENRREAPQSPFKRK